MKQLLEKEVGVFKIKVAAIVDEAVDRPYRLTVMYLSERPSEVFGESVLCRAEDLVAQACEIVASIGGEMKAVVPRRAHVRDAILLGLREVQNAARVTN